MIESKRIISHDPKYAANENDHLVIRLPEFPFDDIEIVICDGRMIIHSQRPLDVKLQIGSITKRQEIVIQPPVCS